MIQRIIHQIWLQGEMPKRFRILRDRMLAMHPGWDYCLWDAISLKRFLLNGKEFDTIRGAQFKADIARYELLARFGGVYVDTDFLFYRPMDELVDTGDHFLVWESTGLISNACIGMCAGASLGWALVRCIPHSVREYATQDQILQTGPHFLTRVVETQFPASRILPPQAFMPFGISEISEGLLRRPPAAAFAAHLWNAAKGPAFAAGLIDGIPTSGLQGSRQ